MKELTTYEKYLLSLVHYMNVISLATKAEQALGVKQHYFRL